MKKFCLLLAATLLLLFSLIIPAQSEEDFEGYTILRNYNNLGKTIDNKRNSEEQKTLNWIDISNSLTGKKQWKASYIGLYKSDMADIQGSNPAVMDESELAKKSQNPVANMASLPFQFNGYFGNNPGNRTAYVLNIQPVVPFELNSKWNLITRNIIPVKNMPILGQFNSEGVGDITSSLFFSPVSNGEFTWGAGPVFNVPTATDTPLGTGKWGIGPTAVVVWSKGPWVYGGLLNNIWSFGGDPSRKAMNLLTCQPFVNYNFKSGYYLSSSPIINADWTQPEKDRWTVPLGLGAGKIIAIGHQPVNVSLALYSNVVKPTNGPDWQIRLSFQFIFAK